MQLSIRPIQLLYRLPIFWKTSLRSTAEWHKAQATPSRSTPLKYRPVSLPTASFRVQKIHTGGTVNPSSASSCGRLAAQAVKSINIDLFFFTTGTWNVSRGVPTPSMNKVEIKLAALESSASCFPLADSTKFDTVSKFRLAALDTEDQLPIDMQDSIRDLETSPHVAPLSPTSTNYASRAHQTDRHGPT